MIDFSKATEISDDYGVITQITDASGRVLWALSGGGPIVLQVEKITSDTYAGETTYTGEQFILLDIYPKTNGTVSVTYGGLTKTITDTSGAEEPNAQQVFFGTFNGVADSVTTPASGELTIDGDCYAFGIGEFQYASKATDLKYCACITAVSGFGAVTKIHSYAFGNAMQFCDKITNITVPSSVTSIDMYAFLGCKSLASFSVDSENEYYSSDGVGLFDKNKTEFIACTVQTVEQYVIPSGVTSISTVAFMGCASLKSVTIPSSVNSIGQSAFKTNAAALMSVTILATTPPTLVDQAFNAISITVPKGCGAAYKAAEYWSELADIIVEAS